MEKPNIIGGGKNVDDRGVLRFFNDFNFSREKIQRFYQIENHTLGTIRAWHGHMKEEKFLYVVKGTVLVGTVKLGESGVPVLVSEADIKNPELVPYIPNRAILSAENPVLYHIPAGYAHGWRNLTKDTILIVFSTASLDESMIDDYRFDWNLWNVWDIQYR
jgi:dTDP-4-dehydrorhamnose 3,5-epimerase